MDLSRFRGRNRLLLVSVPSVSDEGAERQRDLPVTRPASRSAPC